VGIAEIPVGAPRPERGHLHEQAEVYVFLSGTGEVVIEGESTAVSAGDSVFIHGNVEHMAVNTGNDVLRLLYFFATDSFEDVVYRFPGNHHQ
jgi:mannose-6-phosphate isomerase-like protein (cupin superfamily)